jgi:hypothetical protein
MTIPCQFQSVSLVFQFEVHNPTIVVLFQNMIPFFNHEI